GLGRRFVRDDRGDQRREHDHRGRPRSDAAMDALELGDHAESGRLLGRVPVIAGLGGGTRHRDEETLASAAVVSTAWSAAALASQPPRAPSSATASGAYGARKACVRARARASGSRGGTSVPRVALVNRSGTPPTADATTRRPHASASS